MNTLPIPEVCEMVEAAKRYVAGTIHFSYLAGPTSRCKWWAKVHDAHPAIRRLADDWTLWVSQCWNEYGWHKISLPESELRRRIAADLGIPTPGSTVPVSHAHE